MSGIIEELRVGDFKYLYSGDIFCDISHHFPVQDLHTIGPNQTTERLQFGKVRELLCLELHCSSADEGLSVCRIAHTGLRGLLSNKLGIPKIIIISI